MAARYKEDGYFRDYSSLSLQRDLVEKKFVSTVAKVYAALTKAQKLTRVTHFGTHVGLLKLLCWVVGQRQRWWQSRYSLQYTVMHAKCKGY